MYKIFSTLFKNYKSSMFLLIFMMFIGALMEVLSVGLFVPIITTMVNNNVFEIYPKIYFLYDLMGKPSRQEQIYIFLFLFLTVFLLKNFYLFFYLWKESNFLSNLKEDVSRKLYKKYIDKDYKFHVKNSSSVIISRLTADLNLFATASQSLIIIIAEILVLVFLSLFLLAFEPRGFVFAVFFLGIISFLLHFFTSKKIKLIGEKRLIDESNKIKKIQDALLGIKDIKVFRTESNFISSYNVISKSLTNIYTWFRFLQRIPRIYFEIILVFTLTFLILILFFYGKNLSSIITIVAVFSVASIRILPSVNKLFISYQTIKFSKLPIDLITKVIFIKKNKYFEAEKSSIRKKQKFKEISFKSVSFSHYKKNENILKNFSFRLSAGDKIAIVGKTGSGKTTFLDLLLGIHNITSGKIFIDGKNIKFFKHMPISVGYVPQKVYLFDQSIKKNIIFNDKAKLENKNYSKAIEISQLKKFINKLPNKDNTIVGENGIEISGGQAQRIGIARALYQNPDLIIFDEPTSALDSRTEKIIIKKIFDELKDKTIIMVTHEAHNLKHFKKVYSLKNKKLVKVK